MSSINTSNVVDAARALNSIFAKWGIKANTEQWNISGELCSGAATDLTILDDRDHNPFIKCDCSYNSSTLCHITQLWVLFGYHKTCFLYAFTNVLIQFCHVQKFSRKVYELDVAAPIPEELWTLTYLDNL